ncbi:MAG: four-helix bundle copper-binding protein [Vicinamibacterales bacterium]
MPGSRSADVDRCIDACQSCHEICTESIVHCLHLGGRHAEAEHLALLMDCADICLADAQFMMRDSPHHPALCAACAEVCDACAKSCSTLADERQMQLCADQCRRCADLCRDMAKAARH